MVLVKIYHLFLEMVQKLNLENIVKYFGQVSIEKIVETNTGM